MKLSGPGSRCPLRRSARGILTAGAPRLLALLAILVALSAPALAQQGEVVEYRQFPVVGSRVAVWIVAQLHLLFAAFVLGVPMFAVICEVIGVRAKSAKYDAMAREFTRLLMLAFSLTAIFGGVLIVFLVGLYPKVINYLFEIFSPTFYIYVLLFFGEAFSLYLYYYTWDALAKRKGLHLALGVALNVFGTVLMFIANAWASFMMSPGGVDRETGELVSLWDAIENPLWWPLNIHRLLGNLALGGGIASAYAAFRFLSSRTQKERAHYDWMGYVGNFVAVIGLIPLPFAGYWLAKEIYAYNAQMGTTLMGGAFSWLFIIQAMLIGVLFIGTNYYLWLGLHRIPGGHRYMKHVVAVEFLLFLCQAIWMTPHSLVASLAEARRIGAAFHPILGVFGVMSAKNTVVNIIILITFLSFLLYRRSNKIGAVGSWGREGRVALPLCLFAMVLLAGVFYGLSTQLLVGALVALLLSILLLRYGGGLESLASWPRWGKTAQGAIFLVAAAVVIFYGVYGYYVPANVRIDFSVHQVFAVLSCIVIVTTLDIFLFLRSKLVGPIRWGEMHRRSQYCLMVIAVTFVMLMCLMGFARSGIRLDYHVEGMEMMRDTSVDAFTPTLGFATRIIAIVTLIFFGLVSFIFWLGNLGEKQKVIPADADPPEPPGRES